ncbi:hypothetical protein WCLP8_2720007 [uncultured Gammaproteobacteria bacterium]
MVALVPVMSEWKPPKKTTVGTKLETVAGV